MHLYSQNPSQPWAVNYDMESVQVEYHHWKSLLFSLWRLVMQKIYKVKSANMPYIFWKNNLWARLSAGFYMGLTSDLKSYSRESILAAILTQHDSAEWNKICTFFVGHSKKIKCNFTKKFIGFTKYTAMKTILLMWFACNIFIANHGQPGTSLRSPKLWNIPVKYVINSGAQPIRNQTCLFSIVTSITIACLCPHQIW